MHALARELLHEAQAQLIMIPFCRIAANACRVATSGKLS